MNVQIKEKLQSLHSDDYNGYVPYSLLQKNIRPLIPCPAAARLGRILVVDDDDAVRETLADLLEVDNFNTVQAVDAAQALLILRDDPASIDALVTDLSMPGADGIALIKQARQIKHGLPAILLTGYTEDFASLALATNGGFHVLRKPVESHNLILQINALLDNPPSP